MKKSSKLLSVILALVMMFSTVSVAFAGGTLNPDDKTTVEAFIKNDNLANVVGQLLKDLDSAKDNYLGTVLKFCFMFVEPLKEAAGDKDVTKLSDEELATLLLNWLDADAQLPTWTGSLSLPDWVNSLVGVLKIDLNDIDSVDGIIRNVIAVCNVANGKFGVLGSINNTGLVNSKGDAIEREKGKDLSVIKGIISWLSNNTQLLKDVLNGKLVGEDGKPNLGGLISLVGLFTDALSAKIVEINNMIKNVPALATSYIYLLVNDEAEGGEFSDDAAAAAGDWGKDANYSTFNADELLAAALLKLVKNDKDAVIAKADADAALEKSFYDLLAENLDDLFTNYDAKGWLNENVPKFVDSISVTPAIKAVFNTGISFDDSTFADIFAGAPSTGILGQVNNLLCKIAEIALVPAENTKLALVKGGNENLNANFKKVCQYILPLMANKTVSDKLGYDFTKFTADAVKTMELKDMAVAILKLFFEDWFHTNAKFNKANVEKAASLEDLGALAVYYTATNTEWLHFDVSVSAPNTGLTSDEATEYILDTGALIGLNALKYNGDKIYFSTTVTSGSDNIADEISDWGLNFVKGIPAVIVQEQNAERMTNARNTFDDAVNGGAFYKVNVVLNELIDFSFFTNDAGDFDKAPTTFKFDLGLFLTNTLLDNIYDFDLAGVLGAFKKNSDANNSLNKTVISAVLGIADRAVTALFKHTDKESSGTITAKTGILIVGTEKVCTKEVEKTFPNYDTVSGHYLGTASAKTTEKNNAKHNYSIIVANVAATCTTDGYRIAKCSTCSFENKTTLKKTGHSYMNVAAETKAATCGKAGVTVTRCIKCGDKKTTNVPATGKHTYKNGVCTGCGAKDPNYKPADPIMLGDINNDKKVDAADARLALRKSVNLEKYAPGSREFKAGDVDKNNAVDAADARHILRASVKLEDPTKW